jgi:predicted aminopeptidase
MARPKREHRHELSDQRRQEFRDFTLRWRGELLALYQGDEPDAANANARPP